MKRPRRIAGRPSGTGRPAGVAGGRKTRILGIDPGSRSTGYGVIDFGDNRLTHVSSGCIAARSDHLGDRLRRIFDALSDIVAEHRPDEMAVETVFMHRNADSALKLGHARAAALLAGLTRDVPLFEYSPNQVKQAVTGRGHAGKEQVQHMVRVLLGVAKTPPRDASDALAVAICHGHVRETMSRIDRAASRATGVAR